MSFSKRSVLFSWFHSVVSTPWLTLMMVPVVDPPQSSRPLMSLCGRHPLVAFALLAHPRHVSARLHSCSLFSILTTAVDGESVCRERNRRARTRAVTTVREARSVSAGQISCPSQFHGLLDSCSGTPGEDPSRSGFSSYVGC